MSNAHRARLTIVAALAALAVLAPAAAAQSAPSHIYWDNTQIPDIARGTLDGNAANTNQRFIPGLKPRSMVRADDRPAAHLLDERRRHRPGQPRRHRYRTGASSTLTICAQWIVTDNQHIYFEKDSSIYGIGRANLDGTGSNQILILPPTINLLSGLAVDSRSHLLDRLQTAVGRANLDGTGIDPSLHYRDQRARRAIAVDGQHLYWSVATKGIHRPGEPRRDRRRFELHLGALDAGHAVTSPACGDWPSTSATSTGPTSTTATTATPRPSAVAATSGGRTSTAPT